MNRDKLGIAIAILTYLKDAEYHTSIATTKSVSEYFHLSKDDLNEIYNSRKLDTKSTSFSKKKIYTQVQLIVSMLRNTKYLKDFPGTKKQGIFAITDKGSVLFTKHQEEIRKEINTELNKYYKKRNSSK